MADDTRVTPSRLRFACAVALFWAVSCALPAVSNAAELLVKRDGGLSAGQRADVRADAGVALERMSALPSAELVTVPDGQAHAALVKLNADPRVDYAAPNVRLHATALVPPLTTDPWARFQWDLENTNDADIDLSAAWNLKPKPGDGVEVAVVDELVHETHEDFSCPTPAPEGCRDQIDHEAAKSFVTGTECSDPQPLNDHGTHIAGTIAAKRDIQAGIAGVAPYARIVPVQALDNCGQGDLDTVVAAFRYAAGKAPIVTGSFATDPLDTTSDLGQINRAFVELLEDFPDTLFVVAAGNEGSSNEDLPVYPCDTKAFGRFEPPNLICVAMSDDQDKPDCQSNVRGSADIFAPGRNIYASSGTGRLVQQLSGTSQAAAVVAGVAALARWFEPRWSGEQLKDTLMSHADPVPGMEGLVTSNGRVNAARALLETKDLDGKDLGRGGPGGTYATCDRDHDGFRDGVGGRDECPDRAGATNGCPDSDGDGLLDNHDNCPDEANADQADMDGDGIGNVCDDDQDGDTKGEADDVCPNLYALTANGCPPKDDDDVVVDPPPNPGQEPLPSATPTPVPTVTPAPTPVVIAEPMKVTIDVKVSRQVAKVTLRSTRATKFSVRVERRQGKRWKRVTTRSLTASAAGKVLTLKKLLKGSYRVTATAAGVKQTVKRFKV